eukprot:TRINITY_DN13333_c0_g1_i1.p1 TRINITY_DN13333_c0_g1~~TRINITY_DN13333_c0_g1_i1.p1  ORF type:complete len:395 (+),score=38.65 TRINITY_DN13333_c0_g1_i1:97-1185(+)
MAQSYQDLPSAGTLAKQQWLIVQPVWGLCNRLRAVVAARMLAEHLGRELVVDWQQQPGCNCPWDRLIRPVPGIRHLRDELAAEDPDAALVAGAELLDAWNEVAIAVSIGGAEGSHPSLQAFEAFHRECYHGGLAYLIDPASDNWRRLRPVTSSDTLPSCFAVDCLCVRAFNPFYPPRDEDRTSLATERARHLGELRPAPAISERIWKLPAGVVSVHIRRTDHAKAIARSPDALFIAELDSCCAENADTRFFLATDDPQVEAALKQRYGQRVLTQKKRTLDRNSPEGIEDAFLDLLLLSQGSKVIGSFRSSFSAMASHYCMVPLHVVDCRSSASTNGSSSTSGAFREVPVVAEDPADDDGPHS